MALSVLLVLAPVGVSAAPRGPQPTLRLKLADLGVPNVPQYLQGAGAAMLTAHFVDNAHLLVTYSLRGLVERIPGDPPDDEDRAVAGLLVELPSGKVLARTRWHLHDYGQYLWSLGGGRFLLRTRSTLTTVAPMANIAAGDAFREMPFMHVGGVLDAIEVSPEGDMVTVESSPPRKRPEPPARTAAGVVTIPPGDVVKEPPPLGTIFFVRVTGDGSPDSPIRAVAAGAVRVRGPGIVPLNSRGYLFARSGKRSRWTLQFDGFDGEVRDLSYVDSSCAPRMKFISPSQFLVFSCRGADDKLMISAFDFLPQEMWEEPLSGISPTTQFAYAQQAGRFAISRTVAVSTPPPPGAPGKTVDPSTAPLTAQEVRIYQMESGDLLAKLICAPVSTSGQNFDLSADGLTALAVRSGVIEVYTLPPPSAKDLKELAEVKLHEPAMPHATRVQLRHLLKEEVEAEAREVKAEQKAAQNDAAASQTVTTRPAVPAAEAAAAVPAPAAVPENAAANAGDVQTPRKPPSLLNPGETVDDGKKPPKP